MRALATRIASVLPHEDPAAEAIGPVYGTADLVSWLDVSKQGLNQKARAGGILAFKTADGHMLYPAWQLDDNGTVRPGVSAVLRELMRGGMGGLTNALWFAAPNRSLDGTSPAQWLTERRDREPVIRAAKHTASRWVA
ncbi:hypothetical protein [Georgenia yuyongxinii]